MARKIDKNRRPIIYFGGKVNNQSILETQKLLNDCIIDGHKDIVLQINSEGGSCDDALALYDIFEVANVNLTTRVFGKANSMTVILMLLGSQRYISKHSRIFLHQMSSTYTEETRLSLKELKQAYDSLKYLNDQYADILYKGLKRKIPRNQILDMMEKETYLSPKEALSLGLVHGIL